MKILIFDKPIVTGFGDETKHYREAINLIADQWLDVETEHLFEHEYNTKILRVHAKHVKAVLDDARIGRMKCRYCGATQILSNKCVHGCHHKWLHAFSQNHDFKTFVYKQKESGLFWKDKVGWITDIKKASRLKLQQVLLFDPPTMCNAVVPLKGNHHDY